MNKKILIIILISLFFNSYSYSASTERPEDLEYRNASNSNFKKGYNAMKQANKYEKKGKKDKAKKRFNDAVKFFVLANDEIPDEPDVLNYLGYSYRKVGDFAMAEIYYSQGLEIDPKHHGLNEYMGKLYIQTNRIEKAKERLQVLKDCKCKEFKDLEIAIKKNDSKY